MEHTSLFTTVINIYLPEPHASLLNGILFGVNLHSSQELYNQLKQVGLLHIVVLSGMNITLLCAILLNFTAFLGKQLSVVLTILTLLFFVTFVGFEAPIIRSAIMSLLTLVAFITGRKNYALFSLFLSIIIIFILWPQWIDTVSLQLSYGASIGIILFSKKAESVNQDIFENFISYGSHELRTSLAAQILTAPIIFFYFKQTSLISPVSNILVSFSIAPLMVLGFATAILGKIHFALGLIPAYLCYGILSYILFVIKTLSQIPFSTVSF